jgi:two-component system sensor histidine kinase/response regulator
VSTIVLIEDQPILLEDITEVLSMEGHNVSGATNGKAGLELIQRVMPDLVICDYVMEGMDGFEVLEAIRRNPAIQHIPFVMLTAHTNIDHDLAGYVDAYVSKPFEFRDLLDTIDNYALPPD